MHDVIAAGTIGYTIECRPAHLEKGNAGLVHARGAGSAASTTVARQLDDFIRGYISRHHILHICALHACKGCMRRRRPHRLGTVMRIAGRDFCLLHHGNAFEWCMP